MQFKGVKGYVVLAVLMLVPAMSYFQKQQFEEELEPRLEIRVQEALERAGVTGATARVELMDASFWGRVESVDRKWQVGELVDSLPGVRVPPHGNQLLADGWINLERVGDEITVTGLMPKGYEIELPEDIGRPRDRLDRSEYVEIPRGVLKWKGFLGRYFGDIGDRTVRLRAGRLHLTGSATPGLRGDWLAEASPVVGKDRVSASFEIYPSTYHLPRYEPEAVLDAVTRDSLQQALRESAIFFEPGESAISPSEAKKIANMARAILTYGKGVEFVIGVLKTRSAATEEERHLQADRVEAVMRLLIEYGVKYEQFDVVEFSAVANGGRNNGVEVLLK